MFAVRVWPLPAPGGVLLDGALVRRAGRAHRPRHRADLPGQPRRQLRPGRPRCAAGDARSCCWSSARRLNYCVRRATRPRRRDRARRRRRDAHHPPLLPSAPPHPHRRDHRARPGPDRRGAVPPPGVRRDAFAETRLDPPFSGQLRGRQHHLQRQRRHHDDRDPDLLHRPGGSGCGSANIGVAVRASAERADRAATLGIPVRRLHTIVWTVATRARVPRDVPARRRRRAPHRHRARPDVPAPGARRGRHRPHGTVRRDRGRGHRPRHARPGDDVPTRQPPGVQRRRPVPRSCWARSSSSPAVPAGRVDAEQVSTWQAAREVRPDPPRARPPPRGPAARVGASLARGRGLPASRCRCGSTRAA